MLSLFEIKRILSADNESLPQDDFRILDSWAEYDEDSSKDPESRNLEYLCYEIETMNASTGERIHCYKAIKFARVIRLPADAKQSTSFMDMQEGILAGVHQRGFNMITIIANMIKPVALGLLFLYGIQGVSSTIEGAKKIAHEDFLGFIGMMQGTFRVLELKVVEAQETEWLREKIYNMEYLTMVRGIPKANKAGEDGGNKGFGGRNINPDSQGTIEELIVGMADYEYVIEVLSTPVYMNDLMSWQRKSQKAMTDWYGQLQGQRSLNMNLSIPMMYMASAGQAQGWSQSFSDSDSVSYSQGESFTETQGQSVGESFSQSYGETYGHTYGQSLTNSVTHGLTQSHGVSFGESFGQSDNVSVGASQGESAGVSAGLSSNMSHGTSANVGQSMNQGISEGTNLSQTHGFSEGTSYNQSLGQNSSMSHNVTEGQSLGISRGESHGISQGQTLGFSQGESYNIGNSASTSHNMSSSNSTGYGTSHSSGSSYNYGTNDGWSSGYGTSRGMSIGGHAGLQIFGGSISGNFGSSTNFNESHGSSSGFGGSVSDGFSTNASHSDSIGYGTSYGASQGYGRNMSTSQSINASENFGVNTSQSYGLSNSESYGVSSGQSISEGWGANMSRSNSMSIGNSVSQSQSLGVSAGQGVSDSYGLGQNVGQNYGTNASQSVSMGAGRSYSQNVGQNYSVSQSESLGQSLGQSVSDSSSRSASSSYGQNVGQSQSVSNGTSYTKGNSNSQGTSLGTSGTGSLATSSSMGLGPSIGYSKSYQWMDQGVKDLLELLEFQNDRIKKALRGEGAFYTYVYIACPSLDALATAQAVAKSTWRNEYAMTQPLQVLDLTESEQKHLLYHFAAFSADFTRENVFGAEEYKYCTVLLPEEYVAYTHLPRISEGGIWTTPQDIPKFAVPSMLKGEIYMGTILNSERFTFQNGYRTQFDYRIDESMLMHGYFTGASRSGKTVAAMRFVAELSRIKRSKTKKRLRIVAMDPKQDWRTLARFVEPERFRFYSMGNPNFHPVKLNPWKVPHGVWPQIWIDGVIDIYCRAYGLLERGKQMIAQVVYSLYDEAGVFKSCDENPNWKDEVPDLSKQVNFAAVYQRFERERANLEGAGRSGNDTKDAYARLLERLSCFARPYSIESQLYGTSDGIGIDDMIGKDDVTVLESKGLENTFKNFIFGVITSGFYKYAIAHEGGYLADDQYETVLIIEEANEILTGNDAAGTGGGGGNVSLSGQSEFEQILDQSAGYGLFIIAITQKIADMPSSIIANSGLVFAGRLKRPDDINVIVRSIGREERMDDRDVVKWFPRAGIGQFVCQASRAYNFKDAEPVLVQISRLNIAPPTNAELDMILLDKKVNEVLQTA